MISKKLFIFLPLIVCSCISNRNENATINEPDIKVEFVSCELDSNNDLLARVKIINQSPFDVLIFDKGISKPAVDYETGLNDQNYGMSGCHGGLSSIKKPNRFIQLELESYSEMCTHFVNSCEMKILLLSDDRYMKIKNLKIPYIDFKVTYDIWYVKKGVIKNGALKELDRALLERQIKFRYTYPEK